MAVLLAVSVYMAYSFLCWAFYNSIVWNTKVAFTKRKKGSPFALTKSFLAPVDIAPYGGRRPRVCNVQLDYVYIHTHTFLVRVKIWSTLHSERVHFRRWLDGLPKNKMFDWSIWKRQLIKDNQLCFLSLVVEVVFILTYYKALFFLTILGWKWHSSRLDMANSK